MQLITSDAAQSGPVWYYCTVWDNFTLYCTDFLTPTCFCLLLESEYNESKNKTNDENNQNPREYIQPNVHVYTKECQGKIRYIHVNIQKIKYFKMLKFV